MSVAEAIPAPAATLRRAVQEAAVAAAAFKGWGKAFKNSADQAAVTAIDQVLQQGPVSIEVGGCEGEKDEAPMLTVGRKYHPKPNGSVDYILVLDPVEGTTRLSQGDEGAMSIAALVTHGRLRRWADNPLVPYTKRLVLGRKTGFLITDGHVSVDDDPGVIMETVAEALGIGVKALRVAVLDRPRNRAIIEAALAKKVKLNLLSSGDLLPALLACRSEEDLVSIGSGGTPEAQIGAIAAACMGGAMHARLDPQDRDQIDTVTRRGQKGAVVLSHMPGAEMHVAVAGITDSPGLLRGCEYDAETGVWLPGSTMVVSRKK